MTLVIGIDLETNGLCPEKDVIIEIGAVTWDTTSNTPVHIYGALLDNSLSGVRNGDISDEIEGITGISQTQIKQYGEDPEVCFNTLLRLMDESDYAVAHNGNAFDRPMLEANLKSLGISNVEKPWIDTMTDIPYGPEIKSRALNYIASDHGFVNPFKHRAVFDVLTMLKVLSHYPIDEVIAFMQSPAITVNALTSKPWLDEGKSNNIAKSLGFRWNGEDKKWQQKVKEVALAKLKQNAEQMGLPLHVLSQ